jgi:hypothetical protein
VKRDRPEQQIVFWKSADDRRATAPRLPRSSAPRLRSYEPALHFIPADALADDEIVRSVSPELSSSACEGSSFAQNDAMCAQ